MLLPRIKKLKPIFQSCVSFFDWDTTAILGFFKLFLEHNESIELFQSLDFHENVGSYSGSIMPIIKEKFQFMFEVKSLLNSFINSSDYIKHKLFIKRKIQQLRDDINRTRKREFEGVY